MWLEREAQLRAARRLRSTVVALDGDRQVVGYSDLSIPLDDPENIHQWGTIVRRDHRGHRLGLALKARNLLEVQLEHPGRQVVHTANAEVNEAWSPSTSASGSDRWRSTRVPAPPLTCGSGAVSEVSGMANRVVAEGFSAVD